MTKRVILGCLLAVSVGCGGTPTATDSGMTGNDSGSTTDTGPMVQAPLAVAMPAMLDLSCLGTATVPTGGAAVSAMLNVTEYVAMTPIRNTVVDLYTNDMIMGTCTAPTCITATTDLMGHATVIAPGGGWVAVHIIPATPTNCAGAADQAACGALPNCGWDTHATPNACAVSSDTAEVLAYNQTWPTTAGATFGTYGFSPMSIGLISSLLGRTLQTTTAGAVSGQVNDCMGHNMANAEARVFHGTTQVVTGASTDRASPRITGLMGTSATRTGLTGSGGTFVGANMPVGDDYHVEIWGVRAAGGAVELIGCEEGRVVAGAITVLVIGPLRTDYATGSACDLAATAAGH